MIEGAGRYLLSVLAEEGSVRYSNFYDGTEARANELVRQVGLHEDKWYSAENLMDLATFQLEEAGLVETTELDEALVEGEKDYLVELTEGGRCFIASRQRFPR